MVTTSKTYDRYIKLGRKEHKHITRANHQITREDAKRRKEQRTINTAINQETKRQ